jgi:copper resistance protein C
MTYRRKFLIHHLLRTARRRVAKITANRMLLFAVSSLFLCIFPISSQAHAFPDHSDPRVGATVNSCPEVVRIWFDSALEPAFSKVMVRNADDKVVDKDDSRVNSADPKLLEVSVPMLPSGKYRVVWKVVARDGHRTNGDFIFKVK